MDKRKPQKWKHTTQINIILTKEAYFISYEQVKQLNEVLQECAYKTRSGWKFKPGNIGPTIMGWHRNKGHGGWVYAIQSPTIPTWPFAIKLAQKLNAMEIDSLLKLHAKTFLRFDY